MQTLKSYDSDKAILYLVNTPIGNMGDMTYRAVTTLKQCDYVFCEDTRVSSKLLHHFDIDSNLESYHEYNKEEKTNYLIELLKNNKSVALISDAGNPIISDPGFELAREAIKQGISVTNIPGASAYTTALVCSGISPKPHTFYGFLDHKKLKKTQELESLKSLDHTLIFYESIHRVKDTLKVMYEVLGDRYVCVARELTKKHEEFIYGNLSELKDYDITLKGEIVIVVEKSLDEADVSDIDIKTEVDFLISEGYRSKEAIKLVAKRLNKLTKEVYLEYHELK